ncbi:MAG: hypothetical protein WCG23_07895 [bacterium]
MSITTPNYSKKVGFGSEVYLSKAVQKLYKTTAAARVIEEQIEGLRSNGFLNIINVTLGKVRGNPSIKATTKVQSLNGKQKVVFDYLAINENNSTNLNLIKSLFSCINNKMKIEKERLDAKDILNKFSKPKN